MGLFRHVSAFTIVLFLSAAGAHGSTVNCNNSSSDTTAVQSAVNGGGTVTITGTCNIGSSQITIGNNTTINGNATFNYTGTSVAFISAGNNNTITGMTFVGGGIWLNGGHSQGGWTITNNTFRDFTKNSPYSSNAIAVDHILTTGPGGTVNTISNNIFTNLWVAPGGWPNFPSGQTAGSCARDCIGGQAISIVGGLDHTTIDGNVCSKIGSNCMTIDFNNINAGNSDGTPNTAWYFLTTQNTISNNTCSHVHRFCVESQSVSNWPSACPNSMCQSTATDNSGTVFKNNLDYQIDGATSYDHYSYSLVFGGTDGQIINNTGSFDASTCSIRPGIGLELSERNYVIQGNVISNGSASPSTCGWAAIVAQAGGQPNTGYLNYNNNVLCGSQDTSKLPSIGSDNSTFRGTVTQVSNLWAVTCPSYPNVGTSNISISFSSADNQSFPSGGNGTWNIYAISTLSLRNVSFYVDGAPAPVVMQELSDVNTNFAKDRKWLYHATFNTSSLGSGKHTIMARATDVSGAAQSVTQNFVVSSGGAPKAQITPPDVSFGSETVGVTTSAQTVTLSNSGAATLTVSSISVEGANASDFSQTTTCGGSLAAGASCTVSATFTPSATGSRTASLSISDSDSGSPQTVSLNGTGASASVPPPPPPPPPPTALPTNLPKGMILWLANNAGVKANGNVVSAWEDQSGNSNNAIQPNPANQPALVPGGNGQSALHFNGSSSFLSIPNIPIDGYAGLSIFLVSANSTDLQAGYGQYAFLYWPETAWWGSSFFGSYQTSSHFRFGTMQVGNEPSYQMPFTRTNSFGLAEWMHSGTTDSMWFNGQSVVSHTGALQSINGVGSIVFLGQGINNTFYAGDVSELIVYERGLSTSERQTVEQYLMNKYHL